jgi:NADH-quinone oxidoreductase subunit L
MAGSSVIAMASFFAGIVVFKKIYFISDVIGGLSGVQKVLSHKYYVDELYGLIIVGPVKKLATLAGGIIDKYVVDAAVNGLGRGVRAVGGTLKAIQTGDLQTYGLLMLGGVVLLIFFIFKVLV